MNTENDESAEALLLVQQAIRQGEAQGVTAEKGVLIGMVTSLGRMIIYADEEELRNDSPGGLDLPTFSSTEEAAAWITAADRQDSYAVVALESAVASWKRCADKTATVEELIQLGDQLITAIDTLLKSNTFDDPEEWG